MFEFVLAAAALIAVAGYAGWRRSRKRPSGVRRTYGVRAWFACGHEQARCAHIGLLDGGDRLRAFPRPDAAGFNCHDCYVRTGEEKPARPPN